MRRLRAGVISTSGFPEELEGEGGREMGRDKGKGRRKGEGERQRQKGEGTTPYEREGGRWKETERELPHMLEGEGERQRQRESPMC